ncbi:MAG: hypothetical protein HYX74_04770 [Acidobacteria bacterium]|nr:hypothetical protein [Acidobacteriota bacterium]
MAYLYLVGIAVALVCYVFYHHASSLQSDEREIRSVEQVELHLAHILRLLDAPDVRLMMEIPASRLSLLLEFSDYLRKDVLALLRLRALKMRSLLWVVAFFASYYLIRIKARLLCGRDDLRFLSGVELALFRSLE